MDRLASAVVAVNLRQLNHLQHRICELLSLFKGGHPESQARLQEEDQATKGDHVTDHPTKLVLVAKDLVDVQYLLVVKWGHIVPHRLHAQSV